MSSLAEVAAALRAIADDLPLAALENAAEHLEHAIRYFSAATEGTTNPDAHDVTALLTIAYRDTTDTIRTCQRAARLIRALADRIASGGGVTADYASSVTPQRSTSPATSAQQSADLSARIHQARTSLPPGIAGSRTDGRWVRADGETVPIQSGSRTQWFKRALELVSKHPEAQLARRVTTHVEVQMAMRMREESRLQETIVIDREVCGRREFDKNDRFACDTMLSWFLAPGAILTVVQYDGTTVTYTGVRDTWT